MWYIHILLSWAQPVLHRFAPSLRDWIGLNGMGEDRVSAPREWKPPLKLQRTIQLLPSFSFFPSKPTPPSPRNPNLTISYHRNEQMDRWMYKRIRKLKNKLRDRLHTSLTHRPHVFGYFISSSAERIYEFYFIFLSLLVCWRYIYFSSLSPSLYSLVHPNRPTRDSGGGGNELNWKWNDSKLFFQKKKEEKTIWENAGMIEYIHRYWNIKKRLKDRRWANNLTWEIVYNFLFLFSPPHRPLCGARQEGRRLTG